MAVSSGQYKEHFNTYLSNFSNKHKLFIFAGFAGAIAVIILILVWTIQPSYEILFSNLSQKDAGDIVEKLREKKISYKLEGSGTTIMVPTDKVYDLRLTFAQDGLPASSSVGYEIFDKTNLGMTDFIQQVNYRRALEGELSRTIGQIETVERARVHIVIPKDALFKEDQNNPTASVILKLRGSKRLTEGAVWGIAHLISSSVEGLDAENITILDTRGRILSDNQSQNNLVSLSASQLDFIRQTENYFANKIQTMLEPVVGQGNAIVRVTAQLNFKQVEKNIEQYDPDNTVVRSEEIEEESTPVSSIESSSGSGKNAAAKHSSILTNYEINKSVQRIVEEFGNITRLSAAVMVNNKKKVTTDPNGVKKVEYVPRAPKEMRMISNLVRTAIGYQSQRNDDVSVVNIDFSVPSMDKEFLETDGFKLWDDWYDLIEKTFLFLAIITSMLIMKSLFSQVKRRNERIQRHLVELGLNKNLPELPNSGSMGSSSSMRKSRPEEDYDETEEEEIMQADDFFKSFGKPNRFKSNLNTHLRENPEEAARLIKVWLMADERETFR